MFQKLLTVVLIFSIYSCTTKQIPLKATSEPQKTPGGSAPEPVLQLGQVNVYEPELIQTFADFAFSDSAEYTQAVQDYISKKQLYLEAISRGYGKNDSHKEEIESYNRQLAKSFIVPAETAEALAQLTYERLKWELNASHILIAVNPYAAPADTLRAYQFAETLYSQLQNGANFDSLATLHSADINTRNAGGNMGWFSALQLIFPLEQAAYNLNIGRPSAPIRTTAGYHLVRLNGKRPYSGKVQVKHILKAIAPTDSEAIASYQKRQIDSLSVLLAGGADFDELCRKYSDDLHSRDNGGLLEPFSIGARIEESFEETAFSLKEGEISKPVKSQVGWHIIRQIRKLPISTYSEMREEILAKVTTDSRGAYLKESGMNRLLNSTPVRIDEDIWKSVLSLADKRINERKWNYDKNKVTDKTLLSIGDRRFSDRDFLNYARDKQGFELQPADYTPEMYFRWYFSDFTATQKEDYILSNLSNWEPDYRTLSGLFQEDVISTNFLNDVIIEKSVSDTLGQRQYYLAHTGQYQWPRKATATLIKANKKSLIDEYYAILSGGTPYRLKRGIQPIYFTKESVTLDDAHKRKLAGLLQIMEQNKGFIAEIGGHSDINEEPGVSASRIRQIVSYLTANGLPITRIREYDYSTTRLADRFDWQQNQRVSFQFFSNDKRDIAGILTNDSDTIAVVRGNYFFGDNVLVDGTAWEPGDYEAELDGHFYRIEIEKIIPPGTKTLKEARGSVIKDYQNALKKQLMDELAVKYPVKLEEEKLKTIFKTLKERN